MRDTTGLIREGTNWMLFVDGENLAIQGVNALRAKGVEPVAGRFWDKDTYLWVPGYPARWPFYAFHRSQAGPPAEAVRAYCYTAKTGDDPTLMRTRVAIRELGFDPRVFKRPAKGVDLALATDLLTLGGEGRFEVAVILAGDGDYLPLIEATKRLGHQVVVGFFPDHGLNTDLVIAADDFIDLTNHFVNGWKRLHSDLARTVASAPATTPDL